VTDTVGKIGIREIPKLTPKPAGGLPPSLHVKRGKPIGTIGWGELIKK